LPAPYTAPRPGDPSAMDVTGVAATAAFAKIDKLTADDEVVAFNEWDPAQDNQLIPSQPSSAPERAPSMRPVK